jgi:uncharacterized protein YjbI with pentapeptide repeats
MLLCQHKTVQQGGSMRILAANTVFKGKIWITGLVRYTKVKTNYFCGDLTMLHRFLWASTLSLLLTGPVFAMCADCDFSGQNLAFADFRDQDLSGANFSHSYLINAKFDGANLEGADFSGARANNATFRNARLSDASFAGAEIELADFSGSRMTGADFSDAFVRHAKMTKDQALQSNYCQVPLRDAIANRTFCE